MQDYIAVVSSVGFPIFIAMFVMIRIESKIEKLITGFAQLSEAIHQQNDTNEELLDLLELLQELNKNLTESKKK